MSVTNATFRVDFPAFADSTRYPSGLIDFWLNVASQLLNQDRWGPPATYGQPNSFYDIGQELFVAHNCSIERKAMDEAANGAPPGVSTGPVASKSVDKVSINYSPSDALEPDAGHWNLTVYGTRFAQLMKMAGAGPFQVGIGAAYDPLSGAQAWAGPPFWPGWLSS